MLGLMQDTPLTINWILARAEQYYPEREVVTKTVTGVERRTFRDVAAEARRIATVLDALGGPDGGRVGTFAWNTARHLALYFAIPGSGRVMHTINIRYFADQAIFTINHAGDQVVFVDRSLLGVFAQYLPRLTTVRHVVVMDDGAPTPLPDDPRVALYADLVPGAAESDFTNTVTDERQAAAICYTTGTTGNPKGVVYTHRSTWLHSISILTPGVMGVTDSDRVLPVVPMFHANAWGLPYAAMMAGAAMVMPGPNLSPAGLLAQIQDEKVTLATGVPTIWLGMVPLLGDYALSSLRVILCGGSAVPRSLSEAWRAAIGLPITQGWGMTETSPIGAVGHLRPELADASDDEKADIRAAAGIAPPGVEMRIVDAETGAVQPWDDSSSGELEVRGPWVARQYYKTDEPGPSFSPDGWLRTGDVGVISPLGYLRIVDRTKDLVKSGGEWISSVELENEIMGHPRVAEAAVIAVPNPKWGERPLACVVPKPGETLTREEILDYLRETLTNWQLPDDVVFLDEIPKTSVGKFSKKTLRERYAGDTIRST